MVGALVEVGVIGRVGRLLTDAVGDRYLLAVVGAAVGLGRAVRDRGQHPVRRHHDPVGPETWSTPAHGTAGRRRCGGPWRSAPTSAATPPPSAPAPTSSIIGIAARNGHPISFWHFTSTASSSPLVTVAVAWLYLWLRYFALA